MAPKKNSKSMTSKDKDKNKDYWSPSNSPRSQAASARALSQYVNKVVADVKKKHPNNKDMQFALAAGKIAEQAENKAQRDRLTNRAANKIGIEKYLASHSTTYGKATPEKYTKKGKK